jgi:hypothetical protein
MVMVNGFRLQNLIREQVTQRDVLAKRFADSQRKFPGEDKPSPESVMERLRTAERLISKLQVLQDQYNLAVQVTLGNEQQTLAYAVNIIGSMGREEKSWRLCATGKEDRYGYRDEQRDANAVYAIQVVSPEAAAELSMVAGRRAAQCREVIAVGNATKMSFDADPEVSALFG